MPRGTEHPTGFGTAAADQVEHRSAAPAADNKLLGWTPTDEAAYKADQRTLSNHQDAEKLRDKVIAGDATPEYTQDHLLNRHKPGHLAEDDRSEILSLNGQKLDGPGYLRYRELLNESKTEAMNSAREAGISDPERRIMNDHLTTTVEGMLDGRRPEYTHDPNMNYSQVQDETRVINEITGMREKLRDGTATHEDSVKFLVAINPENAEKLEAMRDAKGALDHGQMIQYEDLLSESIRYTDAKHLNMAATFDQRADLNDHLQEIKNGLLAGRHSSRSEAIDYSDATDNQTTHARDVFDALRVPKVDYQTQEVPINPSAAFANGFETGLQRAGRDPMDFAIATPNHEESIRTLTGQDDTRHLSGAQECELNRLHEQSMLTAGDHLRYSQLLVDSMNAVIAAMEQMGYPQQDRNAVHNNLTETINWMVDGKETAEEEPQDDSASHQPRRGIIQRMKDSLGFRQQAQDQPGQAGPSGDASPGAGGSRP